VWNAVFYLSVVAVLFFFLSPLRGYRIDDLPPPRLRSAAVSVVDARLVSLFVARHFSPRTPQTENLQAGALSRPYAHASSRRLFQGQATSFSPGRNRILRYSCKPSFLKLPS